MTPNVDSWIEGLALVGKLNNLNVSQDFLKHSFAWSGGTTLEEHIGRAGHRMGLTVDLVNENIFEIPSILLPAIAELKNGRVAVVTATGDEYVSVLFPEVSQTIDTKIPNEEFAEQITGRIALLKPFEKIKDTRLGDYHAPHNPSWFWSIIFKEKRYHFEIMVASIVANLLALGGSLFSMQVWDRVVPAQSTPTLWVLAIGTILAIFFEWFLRISRVKVSDYMGKQADLLISGMFFGRALDIRNDARPKSTGSFISQIKEMEQIRELLTSTTFTAATDIPFALVFILIIGFIGGPLGLVVLMALPLIIIPGLLLQIPLSKLSSQASKESALRHAILVESIEGIEDIKSLQAEAYFQKTWDRYTKASSDASVQQRHFVSSYVYWISSVQQITYVSVILTGAYLVLSHELTTGAVIGCSILSSRAIAPFAQLAQIFTKWQHARSARKGLDDLLKKPLDHASDKEFIRKPSLLGDYSLSRLELKYDPESAPVLYVNELNIKAGEKIALIGKVGAGKSSLLRVLSGSLPPTNGVMTLDGVDMTMINPSDLRRSIGYLSQDSRLFHGSLRENLMLGAPLATQEQLISALQISGAISLITKQSRGMDLVILEGGIGLSGGQRQSVILARTLLRNPNILALDEPTASMDDVSERNFINNMKNWLGDRTLILSTHRYALLDLVDRVIVVDQGRIVLDGAKDEVLQSLKA